MDELAPSIQQFLGSVSWASELESWDAHLALASRALWDRLGFTEDGESVDLSISTIQKLARIGVLRAEIAQELQIARAQGGLQWFGQGR